MRIPRIYTEQPLAPSTTVELEEGASHHLLKVLRMQVGRELILFNNTGAEFNATIAHASKKAATVAVIDEVDADRESPLKTELAIGLSRGERFDWVLQKATELGVTHIIPLFTERTEVRLSGDRLQKRCEQWQKIIIGACEQCQRNRLPILEQPQTLTDYLTNCSSECRLVLHHRTDQNIHDMDKPKSLSLLVGPEGGLSDDEIAQAEQHGFKGLRLGPRVLRTETAPIVALAVAQSLWGDV